MSCRFKMLDEIRINKKDNIDVPRCAANNRLYVKGGNNYENRRG